MSVKTKYTVGDTVWIAGISRNNTRLTEGVVIKELDLSEKGFSDKQYIISVPSPIEPLLEVRNWQTISEDSHGPVGGFRGLTEDMADSTTKLVNRVGLIADEYTIPSEPAPDQLELPLEESSYKNNRSRPRYRRKHR
jgi:hypothetical protein